MVRVHSERLLKEHLSLVLYVLVVEAHGLDIDGIHIVRVCPHQITAGVYCMCGDCGGVLCGCGGVL